MNATAATNRSPASVASRYDMSPPFDAPVELKLMGPDTRRLASLGERARRILAADPDPGPVVLLSFGPGLTMEGAVLRIDG